MKFLSTTLTMAAAILPLAHAIGNAIVFNNCSNTIYVWSVGSPVGQGQTLKSGESFAEKYRQDANTGGITLIVTRQAGGLYDGRPQTDFAYTLQSSNKVWYDISDDFGDPFANNTVAVVPSDTSCQSIIWEDGVPPPGTHTAVCSANSDIQLTLCQDQ